jgi:glycosyltransferase involved in cell wall biosynthesis
MKVLQIINNLSPAGAEILLTELVPILRGKGIEIEIVTIYKYKNKILYERLKRQNIPVHSLDFTHRYDLRILWVLRKMIVGNSYDIIHSHLFPAFYWAVLCNSRCKKMIVSEHSTRNRRIGNILFKLFDRLIYKRYSTIICVGNGVMEILSKWLPEYRDKMIMIYNGIDLDKFANATPLTRESLKIPQNGKIGAMVARFDSAKDHRTIIEASVLLPDLHVLFIGGYEGEIKNALVEHAHSLKVMERIHFLGFRNDIPSLLKLCDLYIHSSNWEGMSLAIVEALASGLPVIASDVDGIREIVQNNESGMLFKRGDHRDLAHKIKLIIENREIREKLSIGAIRRSKEFSIFSAAEKLIALYTS